MMDELTCMWYPGAASRMKPHPLSVAQRREAEERQELRPHSLLCYPGNKIRFYN